MAEDYPATRLAAQVCTEYENEISRLKAACLVRDVQIKNLEERLARPACKCQDDDKCCQKNKDMMKSVM